MPTAYKWGEGRVARWFRVVVALVSVWASTQVQGPVLHQVIERVVVGSELVIAYRTPE